MLDLRKAHPKWGPKKLLDLMKRRYSERQLPAISTAASGDLDSGPDPEEK